MERTLNRSFSRFSSAIPRGGTATTSRSSRCTPGGPQTTLPEVEKVRSAVHARDDAPGFLDQHRASRDVPGRELKLEKSVEKAARGVGEIEGGRPGPSDRLAAQKNIAKNRQVGVEQAMGLEREAGGKESSRKALAFADSAIPRRSIARHGRGPPKTNRSCRDRGSPRNRCALPPRRRSKSRTGECRGRSWWCRRVGR